MSNTNTNMIDALAAAVLGSVSNEMLLNECAGRGLAEVTALTDATLLHECVRRGINTPRPSMTAEEMANLIGDLPTSSVAQLLRQMITRTGTTQPLDVNTVKTYLSYLDVDSLNIALADVDGAKLVEALGGDEGLWEMIDDKDAVAGDWLESNASDFVDRLDTDSLFDELRNRCR